MQIEIFCNVKVSSGGKTFDLRAGVNGVPQEIGLALISDGLAREVEALQPVDTVGNVGDSNDLALESLKVPELKEIAFGMGIEGADSMKKAELIEAIKAAEG